MSSKSKKKSSKTPLSKLQSPQLDNPPSSPSSQSSSSQFSELELHNTLDEASRKFPTFISKSALIAQISEFESSSQQKGCKIWLSESSMLSSSISPASLVSVILLLLLFLGIYCSYFCGFGLFGEFFLHVNCIRYSSLFFWPKLAHTQVSKMKTIHTMNTKD